jgi:polysaccharide deacetylase 2 family uncharacterized protein YibQ
VVAAAQGCPLIAWDVVLDKALHGGDVVAGVGALVARGRPGSIILAHDGRGTRDQTVAALPTLLARLRERGFELVTVSELMRSTGPLPIG